MEAQRWLNARQAAEYCGYDLADHFRKLAQEYRVPKYGPANNRFDRFELDRWMESPRCFLSQDARPMYRKSNRYGIVRNVFADIP